jgi:hypothetical protein
VLRGGSWNNQPNNVRVSNRNHNQPENRNDNIGFRCVRDVKPGGMPPGAGNGAVKAARCVPSSLPDRAADAGARLRVKQQPGPGLVVATTRSRPGAFHEQCYDTRRHARAHGFPFFHQP